MAMLQNCLLTVILTTFVIPGLGFSIRENTVQNANDRPIIGVMSQTTHGELAKFGPSYIAASYIKYLESSGARVVPIMNDLGEDEIVKLFKSINGVLFPGGGVNLNTSGYAEIGKRIVDLAKVAYDDGDYFPIWATCLGFEFLTTVISGDLNILSPTDSENLPLPLNFAQDYRKSKMFSNIENLIAQFLNTNPTTMNNHKYSLLSSKFQANPKLKSFFKLLSTNKDRNGLDFVSTMEGIRYPMFATQWHPEKNSFEWTLTEDIPHEDMSIKVTQYMSNFFVNQARLNQHRFASPEEESAALIYNFTPVYTGKVSSFEQCYFFQVSA